MTKTVGEVKRGIESTMNIQFAKRPDILDFADGVALLAL